MIALAFLLLVAAAAALTIALVETLDALGRLREWHHGWLGAALVAGSLAVFPWHPVAALVLAALGVWLIADDLGQHARQLRQRRRLGHYAPDDSPLHRAYVRAARWVIARVPALTRILG